MSNSEACVKGIEPYKSYDFCYVLLTAAAIHQSWNCIILYLPLCIVLFSNNMLHSSVLLLNKLSFIVTMSICAVHTIFIIFSVHVPITAQYTNKFYVLHYC